MAVQRSCDVCGFYRPDRLDGTPGVTRYTLERQIRRPDGKLREGRTKSVGYTKQTRGGIDLCYECWERIAKPKMRPELRGRTGPKQYRGRVTAGAVA
jgi:hypothetical protein